MLSSTAVDFTSSIRMCPFNARGEPLRIRTYVSTPSIVPAFQAAANCRNRRRMRSCCVASLHNDLDEIQQQIEDHQDTMDACVKREDFSGAASARDIITPLQMRRRCVELAIHADGKTIHLRVGQVIRHQKYDYRGVIVGYDPQCSASDIWIKMMGVDKLPLGRHQPFYHVLCDERDRPGSQSTPATTYVAQENCNLLPSKVASPIENGLITYNFEGFQNGRYIPKSHLRQQYPDQDTVASSDTSIDGN